MSRILLDRNNTYEIRLRTNGFSFTHRNESVTYFGDEAEEQEPERSYHDQTSSKEDSLAIEIPKGNFCYPS